MIPEVATRIAVYWSVSSVLLGYLAALAIVRTVYRPTRYRAAILVFALFWAALCAENAAIRFHWLGMTRAEDPISELIRAGCCVSLIGLIVEWRAAPTIAPCAEQDRAIAALQAVNAELTRRLGMSVVVE